MALQCRHCLEHIQNEAFINRPVHRSVQCTAMQRTMLEFMEGQSGFRERIAVVLYIIIDDLPRRTNSTLCVICSLPAASAIVLYTKQGHTLFEGVPASQAATGPFCHSITQRCWRIKRLFTFHNVVWSLPSCRAHTGLHKTVLREVGQPICRQRERERERKGERDRQGLEIWSPKDLYFLSYFVRPFIIFPSHREQTLHQTALY